MIKGIRKTGNGIDSNKFNDKFEKIEKQDGPIDVNTEINNVEDYEKSQINKMENNSIDDVLKCAIAPKSQNSSRKVGGPGVITIVNSKNGRRIVLSKNLLNKLDNPQTIKIAFTDKSIIIGKNLPDNDSLFNIRKSKNSGVIYSSSLVKEVTEAFKLDFTCRTSVTASKCKYMSDEKYRIAIVEFD